MTKLFRVVAIGGLLYPALRKQNYPDDFSLGLVTTRLAPLQMTQPDMPDELGNDPEEWVGKIGRNAPCPCGSGNKYKHCHGAL